MYITPQQFVQRIQIGDIGNKPIVFVSRPGNGATAFFDRCNELLPDHSKRDALIYPEGIVQIPAGDKTIYILHSPEQFAGPAECFDLFTTVLHGHPEKIISALPSPDLFNQALPNTIYPCVTIAT